MKMALWQRLAVLTLLGWGISSNTPGQAAQFEQQELEQDDFIVLAAPGGDIGYKLLILEQLNDSRPCWSESGSNPSNVEPLLLSFDFTGVCNRLVDSNAFSVRTAGQDQGLQYSLRILNQGEELVLIAASNTERNTYVEIGRTYGIPTGFSRIILNPGWRLTRRAFNGRPIGHVYLTYDQPIEALLAASPQQRPIRTSRPPILSAPATRAPLPDANLSPESGVIPVPSLPPAATDSETPTSRPAPLPPLTPRPASLPSTAAPSPQPGTAPSLSSILPPPPPSLSEAAPTTSPPPTLGSDGDRSDAGAEGETANSAEAENRSNQDVNRPSVPRPSAVATRPPTGVPRTSDSGGAPLRPRSLRRTESTTASQSATQNNRPPVSTTNRPSANSAENDSITNGSTNGSTAVAQAETYQVVVVADSAEVQDQVRALAPNAFLTTINGQVVMQVGVFRERAEADRLQQKLSLEGLPTAVIPVR
jgi:N-acetylmuramoyl-L-alanine amidase